jgi:hypothetical protein
MSLPSTDQIAECKSKHPGTLYTLEYNDGASAVIAKQPPAAEWNRLVTVSASDPTARGRAIEDFARSCIVWPERAVLDAIVSERPALLARFGNELADLAGASEKITAKKL